MKNKKIIIPIVIIAIILFGGGCYLLLHNKFEQVPAPNNNVSQEGIEKGETNEEKSDDLSKPEDETPEVKEDDSKNLEENKNTKPSNKNEEINQEGQNGSEKTEENNSTPSTPPTTSEEPKEDQKEDVNNENKEEEKEPEDKEDEKTEEPSKPSEDEKEKEEGNEEQNPEQPDTGDDEEEEKLLIPSTPVIINSHASSSSITINFEPSLNAERYICSTDGKVGVIVNLVDGNLQCNISNLLDGMEYRVTISAINGKYISSAYETTRTRFEKPGVPELISSDVKEDSIFVNYTTVKNAKSYSCVYENSLTNEINTKSATIIDNTVYCNIENLDEDTEYEIKLRAINGDEETFSEGTKIRTKYRTPEKPTITKIEKTLNSIIFKIKEPKNSTNLVCLYGITEDSIAREGTVTKDDGEYTCSINGLVPNTSYFVKLIAVNRDIIFNPLDVFEIKTNDYDTPSKPSLTYFEADTNSIKATFGISDNGKEYVCAYRRSDESDFSEFDAEISENGIICDINDLERNTSYDVKLIVRNETKEVESDINTIKTKEIKPEQPELISHEVTENSISLKYSKVEHADSYTCYYGTNLDNMNFVADIEINEDYIDCNLDSLTQNSTYYVKLTANNNEEFTDSEITAIKTDYATPEKPILNSNNWKRDDTSLTLTYSKPAYATTFTCYYGEERDNMSNTVIGEVSNNEVTCNITGLKQGTSYFVKLFVTNEFEKSNESSTIVFKTDFSDPERPILTDINVTSNSIVANYEIKETNNIAYICYYGLNQDEMIYSKEATVIDNYAQCNITDLEENTEYALMLTAVNITKTTPSSVSVVRTKYSSPIAPTISEKYSDDNSIKITYANINSSYNYECRYGDEINNITNLGTFEFGEDGTASCNITGLLQKKLYYIELTAINGNEKSTLMTTEETKYSKPEKPVETSSEIGPNIITAYFTKVENATEYACYYGTDIETITSVGAVSVDDNFVSCTMSNLEEDTEYFFKLVASNHNEVFEESDIYSKTTSTTAPKKIVPTLKDSTNSGSSISVIYDIHDLTYDALSCKYGTEANDLNRTATAVKDNISGTVTCNTNGVSPNTEYYFQLTLYNGIEEYTSSIDKVSTGRNLPEKSAYITSTIYDMIKEINIKFTKTADTDKYLCRMGTDRENMNIGYTPSIVNGQVSCTFSNLDIGVQYYFVLDSINSVGTTTSDVVELMIPRPIAKEATYLTGLHNDSIITSQWNINGNYTKTACYIGTSKDDLKESGIHGAHGQNVRCVYMNLEPETTYYISLRTYNGDSYEDSIQTIRTDANLRTGVVPDGSFSIFDLDSKSEYPIVVYANSPTTVEMDSAEDILASQIASEILSADLLQILDDYEDVEEIYGSEGSTLGLFTSDLKTGGYTIKASVYDENRQTVGEYYLNNKGKRIWIRKDFQE